MKKAMRSPRSGDPAADAPAAQQAKHTDHARADDATRVGFDRISNSLLRGPIFDFLAAVDSPRFLRDGFDRDSYIATLTPLASVCHEWRLLAQSRLSATKHASCTLTMKTRYVEDYARNWLQRAASEGQAALELTIVMGEVDFYGMMRAYHDVINNYNDRAWWESLLQCFPNIVRLDVSLVPLAILPTVLEIASRLCPKVKSLMLLSGPMHRREPNRESFPSMGVALCDALQRWFTANGGLRVLTLPAFVTHKDAQYEQFFRAVTSYCPRIEYLLSMNKDTEPSEIVEEMPKNLPVDVWADFCERCPLLREIFWNIVPLTKQYVDCFVATPRPLLEELKIVSSCTDSWYKDLSPVLRIVDAAPRLLSVSFEFGGLYDERDSDDEGESPSKASKSSEIACLLAQKCPKLERVSIYDASDYKVHRLSAEAVEALVRHPSVYFLELPFASVRDQTLVELMRSTLRSTEYSSRSVEIGVNDYTYNSIMELLKFMESEPPERFTGVSLELTVNGSYKELESGSIVYPPTELNQPPLSWEMLVEAAIVLPSTERELQPIALEKLVEAVKTKHHQTLSSINAHVETKRLSNRVLQYVDKFHLVISMSDSDMEAFERAKRGYVEKVVWEEQEY